MLIATAYENVRILSETAQRDDVMPPLRIEAKGELPQAIAHLREMEAKYGETVQSLGLEIGVPGAEPILQREYRPRRSSSIKSITEPAPRKSKKKPK